MANILTSWHLHNSFRKIWNNIKCVTVMVYWMVEVAWTIAWVELLQGCFCQWGREGVGPVLRATKQDEQRQLLRRRYEKRPFNLLFSFPFPFQFSLLSLSVFLLFYLPLYYPSFRSLLTNTLWPIIELGTKFRAQIEK